MKVIIKVVEERRCASCDEPVRSKATPYEVEGEVVFLCRACETAWKRRAPKKGVGA